MQGAGNSSVRMYQYYLRKFANLDTRQPRDVMKRLSEMTSNRGKPLSLNYIKGIISAIIWKLRQEDKDDPILEEYRYLISHIRGKLEREERTNKKTSGYIPKWEEITAKRDAEGRAGRLKNHLVLSLYTYNPPRRILDYIMLKIAKTPQDAKDTRYNYYIINKKMFVFNVFKTAKSIGQQVIEVPQNLSKIINNYISVKKLRVGDLLLGFRNYLQLNYLLKKLLGCGVDNIRHSHTNYAYKEFNIPTNEYMSNLAYKMGHSVETNLLYRKI